MNINNNKIDYNNNNSKMKIMILKNIISKVILIIKY